MTAGLLVLALGGGTHGQAKPLAGCMSYLAYLIGDRAGLATSTGGVVRRVGSVCSRRMPLTRTRTHKQPVEAAQLCGCRKTAAELGSR